MAYSPDYDTADMTASIFDGLTGFIITVGAFASLIVIGLLWKLGKKSMKR